MQPALSPLRRRLVLLGLNAWTAVEALWAHKLRSLLTILGVLVGVVILISIPSVLSGFQDFVLGRMQTFGSSTIYVYRFPMIRSDRSDPGIRNRKVLSLEDAWAIRDRCPSVGAVSPGLERTSGLTTARSRGERMEGPVLRGLFPEVERVGNAVVEEGRFFSEGENLNRVEVAVIGRNVADALFPSRPALGQDIDVSGNRFRVVGVLEKFKEGPFGEANREDSVIMIPYWVFRKHYPASNDHFIAVEARAGKLAEAQEEIAEALRHRRKVRGDAGNDFEMGTARSISGTLDQLLGSVVVVMFVLSSVAFLVGGIGVMNIMMASVKERTQEIGMRKALGGRFRDIAWQFLVEAVVLTGAGGLLGMGLAEALGLLLGHFWTDLPLSTPIWARPMGFGASVLVGVIFGTWPALKAARLEPIRALRYE
jgi:putative ABC transport system permease protein